MRGFMKLPEPALQACTRAGLSFLTDEPLFAATGVRMGFTRRMGGVSEPPYDSLNLGSHVGDSLPAVEENRRRLLAAADLDATALLTLNQVHGSRVLTVSSAAPAVLEATARAGAEGADGLAVGVPAVTALLCFADCVPVVVVSPSGAFAVAHAGWRGALAGIPAKAVRAVAQLDAQAARSDFSPSDYNGYIGPHIMAKCYECGEDVISGSLTATARHAPRCPGISAWRPRCGPVSQRRGWCRSASRRRGSAPLAAPMSTSHTVKAVGARAATGRSPVERKNRNGH